MNDLLTKNGIVFSKMQKRNKASIILITFALLSPQSAFANRPAMQDSGAASSRAAIEENVTETRPTTSTPTPAPSSVELMMQNQSMQQTTGDVLQLPAKEIQAGETLKIQLLDYPRRGMTMDKVQREYGEPLSISDSVGKPPITRWTYNDRVVYFEYSTVLHAVAR